MHQAQIMKLFLPIQEYGNETSLINNVTHDISSKELGKKYN